MSEEQLILLARRFQIAVAHGHDVLLHSGLFDRSAGTAIGEATHGMLGRYRRWYYGL